MPTRLRVDILTHAAALYPGQALLLGKIMDVFTADDMVKKGNFIALMFFVMAIGCLSVYFVLGWSTNVIAQVHLNLPLTHSSR